MDYFYGPLRDMLLIYLNFNYKCPFKCEYCVIENDPNDHDYYTSEINLNFIKKFKELKQPYVVNIAGGEPTLIPELLSYLKIIDSSPSCEVISLFTNMIQDISWFKEYHTYNFKNVLLKPSYHYQYSKKVNFINKIKQLLDLKINLEVEFMLGSTKKNVLDDLKRLLDLGAKVNIIELRNTNKYTDILDPKKKQIFHETLNSYIKKDDKKDRWEENKHIPKEIKDIPNLFSKEGFIQNGQLIKKPKDLCFKGWSCHPLQFTIDWEGEEKPFFKNICNSKKMTISEINDYSKKIKLIECTQNQCNATFAINYFKMKD